MAASGKNKDEVENIFEILEINSDDVRMYTHTILLKEASIEIMKIKRKQNYAFLNIFNRYPYVSSPNLILIL